MEEKKLLRRKKKALSDGNKTLLATICIDLGDCYMRTGRYQLAANEFETVAEIYKEAGKRVEYGSANRMIGEAYMEMREFDKALECQKIHLNTAIEEENQLEEQRALANLGHMYLTKYLDTPINPDKTSLRSAHASFVKSLEVCEKLTNIEKREHLDMTARLLANLGVVQECWKKYEKGVELVQRSIKICKDNDLYEHLQRSYKILGSLYMRKKDYGSAIDNYNLAISSAEHLPNKKDLVCDTLASIADVLVEVGELRGAKDKLRKAYNLKSSNEVDHESITRSLKTVAAMCYTEDSLEITPPTDHEKRQKLYEKLGDAACLLKRYPKALEYYKNMLHEAELNGNAGKDLVPCYISLAQTHKDNGDYNMAIEFFRKEFNVNKDDVKESVETLLNIAEVMELAGCDVEEIDRIYVQIRQKCQLCNAKHLENKTMRRWAEFLRSKQKTKEAAKLEAELSDFEEEEEELTDAEGAGVAEIGAELNLSDITDVSADENDGEERGMMRSRGLKVTRNAKGETRLHTACIRGDVGAVRGLLEQGHPVNVRDYCGWLPIHEACSYGNLEVVKLLVQYKADVNDRGDKLCLGITPLHDACTNGHLDVIRYLLDRGASINAKTDDTGQTPLYFLKQWRLNASGPLTPHQTQLYNAIVAQMTTTLERFGQKIDEPSSSVLRSTCSAYQEEGVEVGMGVGVRTRRRSSAVSGTPSPSPRKRAQKSPKKSGGRIGEARRRICDDEEEEDGEEEKKRVEEEVESVAEEAKNEYKQAIENLRRHSTTTQPLEKKRKSDELKPSPYVTNNDDWLEDDLAITATAKRRKSSINSLLHTSNTRKSPEPHIEISSDESGESSMANRAKPKRKTQVSLINVGFSRCKTSPPPPPQKKRSPVKKSFVEQVRLTEADSSSTMPSVELVKPMQMLSVDVRIEEKLYRVPIPAAEVHNCTIKWLAEEAAKRYFKREGIKPSLELETKNGAILAEEDLVSMLFPTGSVQAEELKATITKRSLPPLVDRYEEACHQTNTTPRDDLKDVLRQTSTVLDLSDFALRGNVLTPLCKAINRQENLVELNLSGNLAKDECFQLLCTTLPSLTNLATLNLSLNNLTADSLKNLSDTFTNSSRPILEKLLNLNLSYNPICDDGYRHLAVITRYLRLKSLNLASVDFSQRIFDSFHNKNVELSLESVESLDLCHNRLDKSGILKFVSWLNPRILEEFDVSGNCVTEQFLLREMLEFFRRKEVEVLFLRKLGLGGCLVGDSESFDLLQMLSSCSLNLSNNKHLTWVSLRRLLLNRPPLQHLDIHNCDNIFKYFDTADKYLKLPQDTIKSFVLSQSNETCLELLKSAWTERFEEKAGIVEEMKIVRFFIS